MLNFKVVIKDKITYWDYVLTVSQHDLQKTASSLFLYTTNKTKASFYLKRALKRNYGIYEDSNMLIEIMPIISIR